MLIQNIIAIKRDRGTLSKKEIEYVISGVISGELKDYQIAAFLMACFINGLDERETADLTETMMRSGEVLAFPQIRLPKVDKHSTGGVGDKVSLILAPLAAAVGLCVPMISGRGLGHTGGTLDKLESIPGFRVGLSIDEFKAQLEKINVSMIGQTENLVPADRILYALRDVTATVESIPLICASIMSKKLAEGIDGLVLDVKFGSGAFMKSIEDARRLARVMVDTGRRMGKSTRAVLTSMEQPLGRSVGNALEVRESIDCLKGKGPGDLMEVVMVLTSHMMVIGGISRTPELAQPVLEDAIRTGAALNVFREMVKCQGGDPKAIDDPGGRLPRATVIIDLKLRPERSSLPMEGFVGSVDAMKIGQAALILGAGRLAKEDSIDPAVGLTDLIKIGRAVTPETVICRIHFNDGTHLETAKKMIRDAISLVDTRPDPIDLIAEIID